SHYANLRRAVRDAKRERGEMIGEVVSEGNVGLMQAVKKFDPADQLIEAGFGITLEGNQGRVGRGLYYGVSVDPLY
ncbi:hypothetical protein ACMUDW_19175, partial [Vibrio cholerae]